MFGLDFEDSEHKNAINFLILCLKFFIHRCKFQNVNPSFQAYKNFVKVKFNIEYKIAENKGKLSKHFKKFSFDLNFDSTDWPGGVPFACTLLFMNVLSPIFSLFHFFYLSPACIFFLLTL